MADEMPIACELEERYPPGYRAVIDGEPYTVLEKFEGLPNVRVHWILLDIGPKYLALDVQLDNGSFILPESTNR